jgi:integrase
MIDALKLFSTDHEIHTMSEVVERVLELQQEDRELTAATIEDYEVLINHWNRVMNGMPVDEINKRAITQFRDRMASEKPRPKSRTTRSHATVNKHLRYLRHIVTKCFPVDRANPEGLGIIDYFKWPATLPEDEKIPRIFRRKDISALYRGASQLKWPQGPIPAPLVWRLYLVIAWNVGPRVFDIIELRWSGIRMDDFGGLGSISLRAKKTGKLQRIPMHPVLRQHIQDYPRVPGEERIFPSQMKRSNKTQMLRVWKRLLKHVALSSEHCMEDMRKSCNTQYETDSPGVGEFVLGHRKSAGMVNAKNYFNPTKAVIRAVKKFPQPKAFTEGAQT